MKNNQLKWLILIGLSLVWGSSFILMKLALIHLSPIQVGAFRMIFAGVFLLLIGFNQLKKINKRQWRYLLYISIVGTFIPVFLFTYAIQHIDSSIVAILNSFTPLNTLLIGYLFFRYIFNKHQIFGVIIGIIGTVLLVGGSASSNPNDNYWYALAVIAGTIGYAVNVNVIKKDLSDLNPMAIAVGNFVWILVPSIIVLYFTGFFELNYMQQPILDSLGYTFILAIFCTGLAMIFFNKMVHISTPIFAASVTYTIPLIALLWGIWDGEKISLLQLFAGIIILLGVYITNKK